MNAARLLGLVLLALGSLLAPHAVGAQAPGPVHRVGIIYPHEMVAVMVHGLRQGLRELGLEEGRHIVLDIREIKAI
jgi:hypothetical protein